MKKAIALLLSVVLLVGLLPMSVFATTDVKNISETQNKVYYSDLFYAYPHLLLQDSFLQTYNADVNYVCDTIYDNYNKSAAKVGTVMERTLEVVTSPADLTKQITDTLGLTNFDKNKAYDTANKKFVKYLLNSPASDSLQSAYGKTGAIMKKTKSIVKIFELSAKLEENKSAEQYLLDVTYTLWEEGILSNLSTDTITNILDELNASGTTLSGILGLAATEIEIAQAFVIALMMEDVRIEIIDEMIASQDSTTILKEGMTRLKSQLSGGFVTYFISNYINDKLLNEVLNKVGNVAYTAIGVKLISDILSIAEKIVFDILLDEIPSYGEVLAYQVLINYSDCLYSAIQAKASRFIAAPLVSNEIGKYESLFNAYVAANNAAFEIVAIFAPYEGAYKIFREAVDKGIEVVSINGDEYSSSLSVVEIESILLERLLSGDLVLIIDNGISEEILYNKAETYLSIFRDSLSESEQIRADFTDKYRGCDIFRLHVESAKSQISGEPTVNWTYEIDENTTLRVQSDTIEADSIYTYNNKLLGDVNISSDINLTFPLEVMGDFCWNNVINSTFKICSDKILTVNGNFCLNAGDPGYKKTSYSYFTLESDAVLDIGNDFNINGYKDFAKGTGYINTNLYGGVYVNGDFNINDVTNTYFRGFLNVGGNLNQTSSRHFLDSTTCKVWVCTNADCLINGDFNIKGAYYGNVDVNWAVFEVSGGIFKVNGNMNATDRFVALRQTGGNSIWTIKGDVYVNALNKSYVPGFSTGLPAYTCNFTAGKLIIFGDFVQDGGDKITPSGSHRICLYGDTAQTISGINANELIINNTSGITFSTDIQVSSLFDHQGNPFTLYNNGTNSVFVDYDGDGLKDNVDSYPTVHEDCIDGHSYGDWELETEATPGNQGLYFKTCAVCGNTITEIIPAIDVLSFSGASLTLQDDLVINYKVNEAFFAESGYTNPYVVFSLNGVETRVTEYTVENGRYVFDFEDIVPHQMNDTIHATLYATYNGIEYASEVREYSVATYCYNMLDKYNTNEYAKLQTLLVDLLNYGAASQVYMDYKTDALVNAKLTEEQKAMGTSTERTLETVQELEYKTIDNPTVQWKGGGLNLQKSVGMRFKITADNIENLTVKVTNDIGEETIIISDTFETTEGGYYVFFDGLNAGQMSDVVYLTVYDGETAVSNTIRYSIESYAYAKHNSSDTNLAELVKAMMKYGDSAKAYIN